jgi:hypothetical protein
MQQSTDDVCVFSDDGGGDGDDDGSDDGRWQDDAD